MSHIMLAAHWCEDMACSNRR